MPHNQRNVKLHIQRWWSGDLAERSNGREMVSAEGWSVYDEFQLSAIGRYAIILLWKVILCLGEENPKGFLKPFVIIERIRLQGNRTI